MIRRIVLIVYSVIVSGVVLGIKPDTTLFFEFPALPKTNYFLTTGNFSITFCSVYIPDNYCSNKRFPVILWIDGGTGGAGDHIEVMKNIFGKSGYFLVNFPLFKENIDPLLPDSSNYWTRLRIRNSDSDILWNSYKIMLDSIFKTIPQIEKCNAFMGGFSNGAHATAVLLNRKEHGIINYFNKFFFVEGGDGLEDYSILRNRFVLYMQGTELNYPNWVKSYYQKAQKSKAKARFIYMNGAGHNFPEKYRHKLREWTLKTNTTYIKNKSIFQSKNSSDVFILQLFTALSSLE